jgi:hypothetical protein
MTRATEILKNCHRALQGPGKVLVVGHDLEMLVNLGASSALGQNTARCSSRLAAG